MTLPWHNNGRRPVIKTASIPSPIGGLNARDSVAAMPVTDAITLRNWFPFPYALSMRQGWKEFVVGLAPSPLPTVAMYSPQVGAQTAVAFSGGNVYALHVPGAAPAPSITGMTNDYWQSTMFANIGNTYLYAVNGADAPLVYDGVTFTAVALQDPPIGFNIKGVDPKRFIHVVTHQRRLWFVEKDTATAWFLPVDQIGGVVSPFPVGQLFRYGGFLMALYTWTLDAGTGMDDKLVFLSSRGEIAIYSGTDPASATDWQLDGVFSMGAPVGRRCGMKYGGDLLVITTDGLVPLSKAVQSTRVNSQDNLTDKIQHTISALISTYRAIPGWELLLFPNENQLWIIIPIPTDADGNGGVSVYSMNTISGAWCQFDNMDIRSSCLLGEAPIFITSDGRVCRAWTGYFDNVPWNGTVGERIDCEVLTAYNYFDAMGQTKRWTMCRPIFQSGTVPPSAIRIAVDYETINKLTVTPVPTPSQDYVWDGALWDNARWDQEFARFRRWQSLEGMGYAAALQMAVLQDVSTLWIATDFVFEIGGTI